VNDPGELTLTESVLKAGKPLAEDDTLNSPYVSPKIAAKYPTASCLALPLIASGQKLGAVLIGFNTPHHITPDEIRRGEEVARHVALAVAKASLYEAEAQRSAQLSRANVLITALGRVAARIAAANDPDALLKTLGEDLKQLGIYFLFAPLTPDHQHIELRFISLSEHSLARIERFTGFKLLELCIPLREIPEVAECLRSNLPGRLQNPTEVIQQAFPQVPKALLLKGVRLMGVEEDTPTICLPLVAQDSPTGVLLVWGLEMQEQDLSSLTIFASQVAIALEKAQLHANLQQMAITDPLTGVYNRRGLADLGQREVERARRYNRSLTAIMLDIDHFKLVNDRYGHPAGDQVLQALAGRIHENIREIDILARYGGEEFVVLLPEIDLENAVPVAERLRQAIANGMFCVEQEEVRITISLGICQADQTPAGLEALIACADAAMYVAKHMGRNCIATETIPVHEGEVFGHA
jgi:diguanylate cyclase (GGDEF)-like protein